MLTNTFSNTGFVASDETGCSMTTTTIMITRNNENNESLSGLDNRNAQPEAGGNEHLLPSFFFAVYENQLGVIATFATAPPFAGM